MAGERALAGVSRQMSDLWDNELGNEIELQVSWLGASASGGGQATCDEPASSAQDDATASPIHLGERRSPVRRQLLRAKVTGLILAFAVVVMLVRFPVISPSPTPTVPPGSDIVLLAHTVPWGELRVDARKDLARYLGDVQGYHVYRLPPGKHALDYVAAPFPIVHCTLSVPRSASDTCKMLGSRELANHPIVAALGALDMGATVLAMDGHVRAKLQTLLEQGSSYPPVTIQPGMHYRDEHGNTAIAQEKMMVAMSVGVAPPDIDYLINDDGQTCGEFCAPSVQSNALAWTLLLSTKLRWTYSRAGAEAFTITEHIGRGNDTTQVRWMHDKWALASSAGLIGNPCFDTPGELALLTARAIFPLQLDSYKQYSGANPANGCLYIYSAHDDPGDNSSAHPHVEVLFRFGVFLAANDAAQRVFRDLPAASDDERGIAQVIRASAVH
jgi:hypothetical protein